MLLVAADTFRAAAVEQLKILGSQIGVPVFSLEGEKDPIKIVKASMKFAESEFFDSVIVDTRGRLEVESLLVEEIKNQGDFAAHRNHFSGRLYDGASCSKYC